MQNYKQAKESNVDNFKNTPTRPTRPNRPITPSPSETINPTKTIPLKSSKSEDDLVRPVRPPRPLMINTNGSTSPVAPPRLKKTSKSVESELDKLSSPQSPPPTDSPVSPNQIIKQWRNVPVPLPPIKKNFTLPPKPAYSPFAPIPPPQSAKPKLQLYEDINYDEGRMRSISTPVEYTQKKEKEKEKEKEEPKKKEIPRENSKEDVNAHKKSVLNRFKTLRDKMRASKKGKEKGKESTSSGVEMRKKVTKVDISNPRYSKFEHLAHIGWTEKNGFEVDNIPSEWMNIFKQAGISKADLQNKETAEKVILSIHRYSQVSEWLGNQQQEQLDISISNLLAAKVGQSKDSDSDSDWSDWEN